MRPSSSSSSPLPRAQPLLALLLIVSCCSLPTLAFLQSGGVPLASRAAARRQGSIQMMAKNVRFGDKGLDKLVEGINVVGDAVKVRTCRVSWGGMAVLLLRDCVCVWVLHA